MSSRAAFLLVLFGAMAFGFAGMITYRWWWRPTYVQPILDNITTYESNLALVQEDRLQAKSVHARLDVFVDRTLGPDLETVEHQLRSRLNRVGEEIGMAAISVSTGDAGARPSPAKGEFSTRDSFQRALRDEVDFIELSGFISGEGTYVQVVELIAALKAEPWIKQLYYVHLDPVGDASRFRVNVRLRTLFFEGRSPSAPLPEGIGPIDRTRLAALTSHNPFALPPPPVEVIPVEPVRAADSSASKPPLFPYDKWVMTGIVSGPDGQEVWLLEAGTGESKLLTPGQTLSDMTLVHAEGDKAEFEFDGKSIQLLVGQSLGEGVGHHE